MQDKPLTEILKERHLKELKVEPYIIGLYRRDQERLIEGLEKALSDKVPYDERDLLSREDRDAFEKGELFL